ncbi:type II toxin-antitoxin system PemK/MazF family toxin [Enterococcus sp. LJL120]
MVVKQGDIIKINLKPKKGHEQQGYRPCICLSYKGVVKYSNVAIFAPISNTKRNYPLYVELRGTETSGKVLLDQLVTLDFEERGYTFVESVPDDLIQELLMKSKVMFQKDTNKA